MVDEHSTGLFASTKAIHDKLVSEAQERGLRLIGYSEISYKYRLYELPCGHTANIQPSLIRSNRWGCKRCKEERFASDASRVGLEIVSPGKNCDYRRYRFVGCGHEQEMKPCNVRFKHPVCHLCHDTYLDHKSNLYLIAVEYFGECLLKLGYAKDFRSRLKGYGLPSEAKVTTVLIEPVETGRLAVSVEKLLHRKFANLRLPAEKANHIFRNDGMTECYPLSALDKLLESAKTSLALLRQPVAFC